MTETRERLLERVLTDLLDVMDCDGCVPTTQGMEYPEIIEARKALAAREVTE